MDDSSGASRAARYRELAATLRSRAHHLKSEDARQELEDLAVDYERLARHAESATEADAASLMAE